MKKIEFKNIKVAGVTKEGTAQDVIRDLILGSGVQDFNLTREPSNEHDSNAVKVLCMTVPIGYVPKEIAKRVAQAMDAGVVLTARLVQVNKHPGHSTMGLTIDIIESKNTQEMSAGHS